MTRENSDQLPHWETKELTVLNRDMVVFGFLLAFSEEGFLSAALPRRAGAYRPTNLRDQAILQGITAFVDAFPRPTVDSDEALAQRVQAASDRLRQLEAVVPELGKRLSAVLEKHKEWLYVFFPEQVIVADQAGLGWVFVSKAPLSRDGMPFGVTYSFRRPVVGSSAAYTVVMYGDGARSASGQAGEAQIKASMLYNEANALMAAGRLEEAIRHYDAGLRIEPSNPSIHNNRATALKRMGELVEAEAGYRRALQVDPAYHQAHFRLACLFVQQHRQTEARDALRTYLSSGGTLAESERLLDRVGEALEIRSLLASLSGSPSQGAQDVTEARRHEARAHFDSAMATSGTNPELAVNELRTAVELDPGFGQAYLELGRLMPKLGGIHESLPFLEKAVQLLPGNAEAWQLYGERCFTTANFDPALRALDRAHELAPETYSVSASLGRHLVSYIESGQARHRAGESERLLRQALQARPHELLTHLSLGRLYVAIGRPDLKRQVQAHERLMVKADPVPNTLGPRWMWMPCFAWPAYVAKHDPCHITIGVALNLGPAIFRCANCGGIYVVDPITKGSKKADGLGFNTFEIERHLVEMFDHLILESICQDLSGAESFLLKKTGAVDRVYAADSSMSGHSLMPKPGGAR